MKRACFINAGLNAWYPAGTDRLKASLLHKGFDGRIETWKNKWPLPGYDESCPYNVKAAAFEWAIKEGHRLIIWGDCSVYAVRNTQNFVRKVEAQGYWLGQSGHNAAETCTDRQLEFFGVTRDWAATVPDCAAAIIAVNMDHEAPRKMIEAWIDAAKKGAFNSKRDHAGQSKDPRFKYGRQDQACLSVIAAQMGVKLSTFLEEAKFVWDKDSEQTFHCQGMEG